VNNDLEGSDYGLNQGTSQHLPGGTEENRENLSQHSQCPS
jgi:hypothetical protein